MPLFPIKTTFNTVFLKGRGNLKIDSDQDMWNRLIDGGGRFSPDMERVADLELNLDSGNLQFTPVGGFRLTVSAGVNVTHQLQLVWPGQEKELLQAYGVRSLLKDKKLYLRLLLSTDASASAKGSYPLRPLSTNFGIGAGANVAYERLKLYNRSLPAGQIIGDFFGGVRLPQQVNAAADVPDAGEVLVTRLGGYLKLNAGLNWGYSLTGSRSYEVSQLKLDFDYALRFIAALSVGYQLAGDFSIEAHQGSAPGWVRFVVRKNRNAEFNFAADLGFTAAFQLNGLPQSADDFLSKLIGTDAQRFLNTFDKAQEFTSLQELEAAVGKLGKGLVHDLSQQWLGKALSDATLKQFLSVAQKVVEKYNTIDDRIIQLYEDYLGRVPELRSTLDLLAGVGTRSQLQQLMNDDSEALDLVRRLWNEKFYDLLVSQAELKKLAQLIKQAKKFIESGASQRVRGFIAEVKSAFPLDDLFEKLGGIKTTADLQNLADEKLQGLVEKIVGEAFEALEGKGLKKALKDVEKTLNKIDDFKKTWYGKLTEAAQQSFRFDLSTAYTRATRDEKLLDVEINLNEQTGQNLAKKASVGDFVEVLEGYNPNLVIINQGIFTHQLTNSARLQVNVFGWESKSLVQVVQQTKQAIETQPGGLLHVYTTEASIKQRKEKGGKFKEVVQSNFLLRTIGETFQPETDASPAIDPKTRQYLLTTLRKMAVQYDLLQQDEKTRVDELTEYLTLAELLGLVPDRQAMARELSRQFPNGLGKVKMNYVVRYDTGAIRDAFENVKGETLRELGRQTMRQFIAAKYLGMRQTSGAALLGFAYLDPRTFALYEQGFTLLRDTEVGVRLPSWFTKGAPRIEVLRKPLRLILITLFNVERSYLNRLVRLDTVLDQVLIDKKPVPVDELSEASKEFVEKASSLDQFRENAFFAIFDKIVHVGGGGGGRRESAMVLEMTPPKGKKVTKILMA